MLNVQPYQIGMASTSRLNVGIEEKLENTCLLVVFLPAI
jgi:hypothetical protein